MVTWLAAALAVVFSSLFLHPYVTYPVSLKAFRKRPVRVGVGAGGLNATLLFACYNEASTLPTKLRNLRDIRAASPLIKFGCYVDLSTDDTLQILQGAGDLVKVTAARERTGKALGMRLLVAGCDTDIVIFTDANVTIEPGSIASVLRYFNDPEVGVVCGTLTYTNGDESDTAATNSLYWKLEETIKRLESASGSTVGADGSIFAMRRSIYPEVPPHLMDDFISSMSALLAGYRVVSSQEVRAFERTAAASQDEFRRKRRIACRAYSSHRYIASRLSCMDLLHRYKYVSHRLIRWYGAYTGSAAALFIFIAGASVIGFAPTAMGAAALFATCWIGGRLGLPILGPGLEVLRAIYATGLGVMDAWRGVSYQTWTQAETR